jgi:hypothetical protein
MRTSIVAAAMTAAALAVLLVAGAAPALAAPGLSVSCSPGPANCSGWYRSAVTVTFVGTEIVQMCSPNPVTVSSDTKGTNVTCNATGTGGTKLSLTVTVRVDRTPPTVSAALDRGPDANGWYAKPVGVRFSGSDATSGIAACTSGTYGGPDSGAANLTGTCTDAAGNTGGGQTTIRYDATPPVVTQAKASRKPDFGHWYRKPVSYTFTGTDATSGLAGCDPVVYRGPDGERAQMTATCRDRAGNAGTKAFALRYDSTPPTLLFPRFRVRDGMASLHWTMGFGASRVLVHRTPGLTGPGPSVVYRGKGGFFRDRGLRTGARYRYLIEAYDQAGNVVRAARVVRARTSLRPVSGSSAQSSLMLSWAPVYRVRYYNVQLYRGGVKVQTFWPARSWLRLQGLSPGRYRWYVWPGIGARARGKYGALIGSSTFVVR